MRSRTMLLGTCVLAAFAGVLSAATAPVDELEGGAAPITRIIDNNKIHVSIVDFKPGYTRASHFMRRSDQLVVYLDDARFETMPEAGSPAPEAVVSPDGKSTATNDLHPRGSVAWHPKGAYAPAMRVTKGFRALYIELKYGTMTWPDPAAATLPPEAVVGGGAPVRELFNNDKLRATLVSFKKGFIRPGAVRRRLDTIIVYVDEGKLADVGPPQTKYAVVQSFDHPKGVAECDPIKDCDSVGPDGKWAVGSLIGTVAWHPKDGYVERIGIGKDYRALYVELKN